MDNSHPEYEDLLRRLEGILLPWAEQYSDQNLNSGSAPHADLTVNDNGRERADFAALERVDAICQDLRSRTQEWLKNRNLHSAQSHQHIVPEECPPEPLIPDRTSTVPSKRPCVEPRPRQTRPKRKKRAPVTARVEVDEGAFEELGILDLDASIECPYMLHSCLIGGHACNSPPVFTGRTAKRDLRSHIRNAFRAHFCRHCFERFNNSTNKSSHQALCENLDQETAEKKKEENPMTANERQECEALLRRAVPVQEIVSILNKFCRRQEDNDGCSCRKNQEGSASTFGVQEGNLSISTLFALSPTPPATVMIGGLQNMTASLGQDEETRLIMDHVVNPSTPESTIPGPDHQEENPNHLGPTAQSVCDLSDRVLAFPSQTGFGTPVDRDFPAAHPRSQDDADNDLFSEFTNMSEHIVFDSIVADQMAGLTGLMLHGADSGGAYFDGFDDDVQYHVEEYDDMTRGLMVHSAFVDDSIANRFIIARATEDKILCHVGGQFSIHPSQTRKPAHLHAAEKLVIQGGNVKSEQLDRSEQSQLKNSSPSTSVATGASRGTIVLDIAPIKSQASTSEALDLKEDRISESPADEESDNISMSSSSSERFSTLLDLSPWELEFQSFYRPRVEGPSDLPGLEATNSTLSSSAMSEMSIVTIEPSPIRGADQLAAPDHHRADNPPRPVVIVGRFRQELLDETKFYHGEESRGGRASGRVSNATVEESTAVEANIAEKGQADRGADDEAQISARRNLQSGATTDGDRKGKGVDRSEGGGDGMGQASSSGIKLGRKNPKHSLLGGPNKASSSYMASRVQGQERELEASGPDSEDSDLEDSKSNLD